MATATVQAVENLKREIDKENRALLVAARERIAVLAEVARKKQVIQKLEAELAKAEKELGKAEEEAKAAEREVDTLQRGRGDHERELIKMAAELKRAA
ncbi:MAG: hypothetical protein WDN10_05235 [bacterium]